MSKLSEHISQTISAKRGEYEITQKELADIIGTSPTSLGKYERGEAIPDVKTMVELADFFDMSLDDLCGRNKRKMNDINTLGDVIRILEKLNKTLGLKPVYAHTISTLLTGEKYCDGELCTDYIPVPDENITVYSETTNESDLEKVKKYCHFIKPDPDDNTSYSFEILNTRMGFILLFDGYDNEYSKQLYLALQRFTENIKALKELNFNIRDKMIDLYMNSGLEDYDSFKLKTNLVPPTFSEDTEWQV